MKINFGKILKVAPAVIGLVKGTVEAVKGKKVQDQIEIGAESLIQMLPIIEATLDIDVADNGKWSEAVSKVLHAEQTVVAAKQAHVEAIAALVALIDDLKGRSRD